MKATRYIYDDGDFVPPNKSGYDSENEMMAPVRGLPPMSALPVPAFSFRDEGLKKQYLGKPGKAEVGTFWGRADKEGNVYYYVNSNAFDPVDGTQYFRVNPKYDFQSNYREVPELAYILSVLMTNAQLYADNDSKEKVNFALGFDNLVQEYNRILSDLDNTTSSEPAGLDKRLNLGELRDRFKTLLGLKGAVQFAGETMRPQTDQDWKQLPTSVSNSGYEKKSDLLVLGIEYPFGHYMQGMPIAEADKWFGRKGMWDFGDEEKWRPEPNMAGLLPA